MLSFNNYKNINQFKKVIRLIYIFIIFFSCFSNVNAFSLSNWFDSNDQSRQLKPINIKHNVIIKKQQKHSQIVSTQISRYVSQKEYIPNNQINLLDQNISIIFSNKVTTINDAVALLLFESGFRLQPVKQQDKYTKLMLDNSLPAIQQVIKNKTLKKSLLDLTGHQFKIVIDPIHRIITFKIRPTVLAMYLNNQGI